MKKPKNRDFIKNLIPAKKGEVRNPKGNNGFGVIPEADAIFRAAIGNDEEKPEKNVLVKLVKNLLVIGEKSKTPHEAANAIRATELLFNRVFGMPKRNDVLTLRALTESELTASDETAQKLLESYYLGRPGTTSKI